MSIPVQLGSQEVERHTLKAAGVGILNSFNLVLNGVSTGSLKPRTGQLQGPTPTD